MAQAQEPVTRPVEAYDLTEIVVTASRRAESALRMPYFVNTQDMVQLQERRQIRTIPDAMREMPSVMVQKTGHGQGSPYIRGFTGPYTLPDAPGDNGPTTALHICAGSGIVPSYSILKQDLHAGSCRHVLLYSNRTREDTICGDALEEPILMGTQ